MCTYFTTFSQTLLTLDWRCYLQPSYMTLAPMPTHVCRRTRHIPPCWIDTPTAILVMGLLRHRNGRCSRRQRRRNTNESQD